MSKFAKVSIKWRWKLLCAFCMLVVFACCIAGVAGGFYEEDLVDYTPNLRVRYAVSTLPHRSRSISGVASSHSLSSDDLPEDMTVEDVDDVDDEAAVYPAVSTSHESASDAHAISGSGTGRPSMLSTNAPVLASGTTTTAATSTGTDTGIGTTGTSTSGASVNSRGFDASIGPRNNTDPVATTTMDPSSNNTNGTATPEASEASDNPFEPEPVLTALSALAWAAMAFLLVTSIAYTRGKPRRSTPSASPASSLSYSSSSSSAACSTATNTSSLRPHTDTHHTHHGSPRLHDPWDAVRDEVSLHSPKASPQLTLSGILPRVGSPTAADAEDEDLADCNTPLCTPTFAQHSPTTESLGATHSATHFPTQSVAHSSPQAHARGSGAVVISEAALLHEAGTAHIHNDNNVIPLSLSASAPACARIDGSAHEAMGHMEEAPVLAPPACPFCVDPLGDTFFTPSKRTSEKVACSHTLPLFTFASSAEGPRDNMIKQPSGWLFAVAALAWLATLACNFRTIAAATSQDHPTHALLTLAKALGQATYVWCSLIAITLLTQHALDSVARTHTAFRLSCLGSTHSQGFVDVITQDVDHAVEHLCPLTQLTRTARKHKALYAPDAAASVPTQPPATVAAGSVSLPGSQPLSAGAVPISTETRWRCEKNAHFLALPTSAQLCVRLVRAVRRLVFCSIGWADARDGVVWTDVTTGAKVLLRVVCDLDNRRRSFSTHAHPLAVGATHRNEHYDSLRGDVDDADLHEPEDDAGLFHRVGPRQSTHSLNGAPEQSRSTLAAANAAAAAWAEDERVHMWVSVRMWQFCGVALWRRAPVSGIDGQHIRELVERARQRDITISRSRRVAPPAPPVPAEVPLAAILSAFIGVFAVTVLLFSVFVRGLGTVPITERDTSHGAWGWIEASARACNGKGWPWLCAIELAIVSLLRLCGSACVIAAAAALIAPRGLGRCCWLLMAGLVAEIVAWQVLKLDHAHISVWHTWYNAITAFATTLTRDIPVIANPSRIGLSAGALEALLVMCVAASLHRWSTAGPSKPSHGLLSQLTRATQVPQRRRQMAPSLPVQRPLRTSPLGSPRPAPTPPAHASAGVWDVELPLEFTYSPRESEENLSPTSHDSRESGTGDICRATHTAPTAAPLAYSGGQKPLDIGPSIARKGRREYAWLMGWGSGVGACLLALHWHAHRLPALSVLSQCPVAMLVVVPAAVVAGVCGWRHDFSAVWRGV